MLEPDQFATMQRIMFQNVEGIDGVLQAWSRGDRAGMAAAARRVADDHPGEATPSLRAVLPPEWSALGAVVHTELGALADALDAGLPESEVPGRLARVTSSCVACHQRFRYRQVGD
jgi:hypothetical protein